MTATFISLAVWFTSAIVKNIVHKGARPVTANAKLSHLEYIVLVHIVCKKGEVGCINIDLAARYIHGGGLTVEMMPSDEGFPDSWRELTPEEWDELQAALKAL